MAANEWLIPLALALVAGATIWLVAPDDATPPEADHAEPADHPGGHLVWPLGPARVADAPDATLPTLLVIAPDGTGPEEPLPRDSHVSPAVEWRSPWLGLATPVVASCLSIIDCSHPWVATAHVGPRLGMDGYDAADLTVHVFTSAGLLRATTADPEALPWPKEPSVARLPTATWFLGGGPAPNGTQSPPGAAGRLIDEARPFLVGLPEGGIATVEWDITIDVLYVTAQVDRLHPA